MKRTVPCPKALNKLLFSSIFHKRKHRAFRSRQYICIHSAKKSVLRFPFLRPKALLNQVLSGNHRPQRRRSSPNEKRKNKIGAGILPKAFRVHYTQSKFHLASYRFDCMPHCISTGRRAGTESCLSRNSSGKSSPAFAPAKKAETFRIRKNSMKRLQKLHLR